MSTKKQKEELNALIDAILKIENKEECEAFLNDLLTTKEIESLSGRIAAAKLFLEGKTYIEVTKETTVSSATLARVSKCVKHGKGYNSVLKK